MNATWQKIRCAAAAGTIAIALLPGGAFAQSGGSANTAAEAPVQLSEGLAAAVKLGQTVLVVDMKGERHDGIVADVSPLSLVLVKSGKREEMGSNTIDRIMRNERDSLENGAAIGFLVGAGAVFVPAAIYCLGDGYCGGADWSVFGFVSAIYGGIGAAIGTGIDALIRDHTVVYRRNGGTSPSFTIAPLVSSRTKGVALSLRWGAK